MNAVLPTAVWLPTIRTGTGSDVFTMRLCKGLNARGIRSEIAWIPHRAEYLPWTVPPPSAPDWATIAHVNSWLPRRFWPAKLPVVTTVHHLVHDPAYRPFRSFTQAIYHQLLIRPRELRAILDADAVTAVSNFVRRTVEDFSGRKSIAVVNNWVESGTYTLDVHPSSCASNTFTLLMAGSCSRRKGVDLLAAFIKALGPGFDIRYAGGTKTLGLQLPGLTELGRIDEQELLFEFQQCDAVISLSRYEGFGYTAIEAAACGKPFLGFNTSALAEVVTEQLGTLVELNDVAALAAAVQTLRDNKTESIASAEVRHKLAFEKFGESNIEAYIDIYTQLISNQRAPREA